MEEKVDEESQLKLSPEAAPEIRYAHYRAIAETCKDLLNTSDDKLRLAIEKKLAWAESCFKETHYELWEKDRTRYYWNSTASGMVALDDEMRIISDRKVACKWILKYSKKSIILPPSTPVFVGWVGDDQPEKVFTDGDYIGKLYQWVRSRVIDDSVEFLSDLDKLVHAHPLIHIGKLYFTQMQNGVWELRWNHKHRALPIAEDWFLLELSRMLEQVANLELSADSLWQWVDEIEAGFKCNGKLNGKKISLAYYSENGTWGWRLSYCRKVQRVRRYWVGAISKAIKSQDEKALWDFIHSAN